jgi:hypothetical protein
VRVHFCIIGGPGAVRLQKRTHTVPNCSSGLGGGLMMQKCTLTALKRGAALPSRGTPGSPRRSRNDEIVASGELHPIAAKEEVGPPAKASTWEGEEGRKQVCGGRAQSHHRHALTGL